MTDLARPALPVEGSQPSINTGTPVLLISIDARMLPHGRLCFSVESSLLWKVNTRYSFREGLVLSCVLVGPTGAYLNVAVEKSYMKFAYKSS